MCISNTLIRTLATSISALEYYDTEIPTFHKKYRKIHLMNIVNSKSQNITKTSNFVNLLDQISSQINITIPAVLVFKRKWVKT